jgi:hypothetical protein
MRSERTSAVQLARAACAEKLLHELTTNPLSGKLGQISFLFRW